jgi:hypothetical protein
MGTNSTIDIMLNEARVSEQTWHIDIQNFWIHEREHTKDFTPEHIPSVENVADIFTKPPANPSHKQLISMLRLTTHTNTC